MKTHRTERQLKDLEGVGQAVLADLQQQGVPTVAALAKRSPQRLYETLCRDAGKRLDPCVLDTLRCAVAQARDPHLPDEQRKWWYWSRQRKAEALR
jgi:hypothetical protein